MIASDRRSLIRRRPLTSALLMALSLYALPAQAALQQLLLATHYDGTEGFDSAASPGRDTGPNNNIVRTHDTFQYRLTYSTNSADDDLRVRISLPASASSVARWSFLPPECLAASSSLSADRLTIDCHLGDQAASGTQSLYFRGEVLGSAPNGAVIATPTLSFSSTQTPATSPTSLPEPLQVSAAPFYDVVYQLPTPSGTYGLQTGSGPNGETGFYHRVLIGLVARNPHGHGKKGIEQLRPNAPIEIDVDVRQFPASVRVDNWHTAALVGNTNAATIGFPDGCGSLGRGIPSRLAGGTISQTSRVLDLGPSPSKASNSVANGGECQVVGSDRNTVRLQLAGVDTSLMHTPTQIATANGMEPLPADEFWVAQKALVLWTDFASYPSGRSINHVAGLSRLAATSISNQSLTGDRTNNNTQSYAIQNNTAGSVSKYYMPDQSLPTPYQSHAEYGSRLGNVNQLVAGQTVAAQLSLNNRGTTPHSDAVLCEIIDRTAFDIGSNFSARPWTAGTGDSTPVTIRYGARAEGTPYFASTDSAPNEQQNTSITAGQSAYSTAQCADDGSIQWFDTPQQAEAAGGLVFVRLTKPSVVPNQRQILLIQGLILRSTWAETIQVLTPTAETRRKGDPIPEGSILRNRSLISSATMPTLANATASIDHLRVIQAQTLSRLAKTVIEPANAATVPVKAGSTLRYRLQPSYATLFPAQPGNVQITDVLPPGMRYISGSATVGGNPLEPRVQNDTPAAGYTTLSWQFTDVLPYQGPVTAPVARMPAIEFQARISPTAADGAPMRNQASISGGRYDLEADCSYDAANGGFGTCAKAASSEITIQSPPGFFLEKTTSRASIEPGDPFDYTISYMSKGDEITAPNLPDLIDILPFIGDGESISATRFSGRNPASSFEAGAYRLKEVLAPAVDPGARIYYTRRPPREIHSDPQDSSNLLPGGSTRWCLASEFGSLDCPANIGESTAIRISPAIARLAANTTYDVTLNLETDPLRTYPGNIFANRASARPVDPGSTLLYVESQANMQVRISMAMSSLGGRYFADINRNQVFDPEDWAVADQCIRLEGSNIKGHTLNLSMRTDAQGYFRFAEGASGTVYPNGDCSGTPLPRFGGLMQGHYTLSRPADSSLNDMEAGALAAGTAGGNVEPHRIREIALPAQTDASGYHFTADPVRPRLSLVGTLTNDHGGNASAADITLSLLGGASGADQVLTGNSGSAALSDASVPAGSYTLHQGSLPGYRPGTWQCVINGQPAVRGNTLKLDYGDQAVCSIDYDDQPARLTLSKALDIRFGREASPSDFVLQASGLDSGAPQLSGRSGEPAITAVEVPAGRYRLSEQASEDFMGGPWQCSLTLANGQTDTAALDESVLTLGLGEDAHCTITNTDAPVRISLDQIVTLDGDNDIAQPGESADPSLPAVVLFITPSNDPSATIRLDPSTGDQAAAEELRVGQEYELSVSQTPGYQTKLVCLDANGRTMPLRLRLGEQSIGCRVERKRIPTVLALTKEVEGEVRPVAGDLNEYEIAYTLTVRHTGGADGIYDLVDTPAFDPDVQIIAHQASRNGQSIDISPVDGQWPLARQQALAMDGSDSYRLNFRIRVPFGSSTGNDSCAAATAGRGLYNRATLNARNDLAAGDDDRSNNGSYEANACIASPEPITSSTLSIEKTSASRSVEVGDLISYRLRVRNSGDGPALSPVIVDRLPRGFRFEPSSLRVQGARQAAVRFTSDRELRLTLERVEGALSAAASASADGANPGEVLISYRVRVGVGAQESDGTNRAHVECPSNRGRGPATRCSNESRWKVQVKPGIFSEEACLAGQIFVDCNGNSVKEPEELGIPGVRLYLQNGTWLVSDEHGKYSHCGLRPRTHVLKVDSRTLPRRTRLVTSSAQNSGDAHSLFVDARTGMLHRADFIEGSCSAGVIEQVKARQAQGAEASLQTEAGQPALSFESKTGAAAAPWREGTDGAAQARSTGRH